MNGKGEGFSNPARIKHQKSSQHLPRSYLDFLETFFKEKLFEDLKINYRKILSNRFT